MLDCPKCENWFHGDCVGIKENEKQKIKKFKCQRCKEIESKHHLKCQNCLKFFEKPEDITTKKIRKFYCSSCLDKNSSLKITYYSIFDKLKKNGDSFSSSIKDKSKRIAPGGNVTVDHVQEKARKRQNVVYFSDQSKTISRNSKNISEVRNNIQDDMEYEKRKTKEENQFKKIITKKLMKQEEKEEEKEKKEIPLSEEVLIEIERLGGKYEGKPSRFYNGNIHLIPPSIQYFLDCQFDHVLVSEKFNILHLEINGEFKIKEWEEFKFLNENENDFILFGWGEILLAGLQFDEKQNYQDFNVYILDEKESFEGPYKLSQFLKEFV